MVDHPLDYVPTYWNTAESSPLNFLRIAATEGHLQKEMLPKILEKCFLELDFKSGCVSDDHFCRLGITDVKPFFQILMDKQLISHSELATIGTNYYLANINDMQIRENVAEFMSWSFE